MLSSIVFEKINFPRFRGNRITKFRPNFNMDSSPPNMVSNQAIHPDPLLEFIETNGNIADSYKWYVDVNQLISNLMEDNTPIHNPKIQGRLLK